MKAGGNHGSERSDKSGIRAAPSCYQVIAGTGAIADGWIKIVCSGYYVVKVAGITGAIGEWIEQPIEQADRLIAIGERLLIHQGHVRRPARRGKTGARPASGTTSHIAVVVVEIGLHRDIGNIAIESRCLVRRVGNARLPGRNGDFVQTNAAAASIPCGFRGPRSACSIRGQSCSSHSDYIIILGRIKIGDPGVIGAVIARGNKYALPLRGHLLKKDIVRCRIVRHPCPRDAHFLG